MVAYGLPETYLNDFMSNVDNVTRADVNRIANKYLGVDQMAIVVVGDRKIIEPGFRQLGYPLEILNGEVGAEESGS